MQKSFNIPLFEKIFQAIGIFILLLVPLFVFSTINNIDSYFEQKFDEYISSKSISLKQTENEINAQLVEYIKNDLAPIFLNVNLGSIFTDMDSLIRSQLATLSDVYSHDFVDNIKSKTYEKDNNLKAKNNEKEKNNPVKSVLDRIASIVKVGQEYKQKYKSSLGNIIVVPKLGACGGIGQCLVNGYLIDTDNNYISFLDKDTMSSFLENKDKFITIDAPSRIMYFEKDLLIKDYLERFDKLMILQKSSASNSEALIKNITYNVYYDYLRFILVSLFILIGMVLFVAYVIYIKSKLKYMERIIDLKRKEELIKAENDKEREQLTHEKNKLYRERELFIKEKSTFEKFQAKYNEREKALDILQTELYHDTITNTGKVIELSELALLLILEKDIEGAIKRIQRIHDLEDCKNKGMSINKLLIENSSIVQKGTISVYFPYYLIHESLFKNMLESTSPLIKHNIQEWDDILKKDSDHWSFFKIENYIADDLSRIIYKLLSNAYKHNNFDFMPQIKLNFLLLNNYFEIRVSNYLVNSSVTEELTKNSFHRHGNLAAAYKLATRYNLELDVQVEKEKREIHFVIKGKNSND